MARLAGVFSVMSGTTFASSLALPQTTPAAPAYQAPAAELDERATATRTTTATVISPSCWHSLGSYLKASKCANCRGLLHDLIVITLLRPGWVCHAWKIVPSVLSFPAVITPLERIPPWYMLQISNKTCTFSPGYVTYHITTGNHPG